MQGNRMYEESIGETYFSKKYDVMGKNHIF